MLHSFRLYCKLIATSIKSQMQHRASFLMETVGNFFASMIDIIGIWVLIDRFHTIRGWTLEELALIYGVVHIGFSIGEATARSFEKFSQMVKTGGFDRILLRPLGTIFQVASSHIQALKLGRLLQGLFVLIWGFYTLGLPVCSIHTLVILLGIVGTACLFYGLFIIQATLCFWTTQTLEVIHITTYGGREIGQYPVAIFHFPLKLVFTSLIPLACAAYYPIAILLHHENLPILVACILPFTGIFFLYAASRFWRIGVRRYCSTGS